MTVPTSAKSLGEEGQPGSVLRGHGTVAMYQLGGCRCGPCRRAKAKKRKYPIRAAFELTREEAKRCQVCQVALSEHPLKWCWREMR